MPIDNHSTKQTVFKEENNQPDLEHCVKKLGSDKNIAGMLCYLCWFITGIIFFVIENESRFVRFHAIQSILTSIVITMIFIIIEALTLASFINWMTISIFITLFVFLWIVMMYKAYLGEWFKLPIVGDISRQLSSA